MKLWFFAGLLTMMWAPMAVAAESTVACDVDDTQQTIQQRADSSPAAPAVTVKQRGGGRGAVAVLPRTETAAPTIARTEPSRRRGVTRRIPDAELIGGRGAL